MQSDSNNNYQKEREIWIELMKDNAIYLTGLVEISVDSYYKELKAIDSLQLKPTIEYYLQSVGVES